MKVIPSQQTYNPRQLCSNGVEQLWNRLKGTKILKLFHLTKQKKVKDIHWSQEEPAPHSEPAGSYQKNHLGILGTLNTINIYTTLLKEKNNFFVPEIRGRLATCDGEGWREEMVLNLSVYVGRNKLVEYENMGTCGLMKSFVYSSKTVSRLEVSVNSFLLARDSENTHMHCPRDTSNKDVVEP